MKELSATEKRSIQLILLWITTLGQASIALYLPALPFIAHSLMLSPTAIKQTITIFIIGCGISPIFHGPLSDRYGRKPILLFSILCGCTGYFINLWVHTLGTFLLARVIQEIGCGGIFISGRSIMRDVFSGAELASTSSYLSMGFAIGFGISPTIGGYLSHHIGWRTNFLFLLLMGIIIFISILRTLPETLPNKHQDLQFSQYISKTFNDYKLIIQNYQFLRMLGGGLFAYGIVMAYNIMSPFLLQNTFKISAINYGYLSNFT